MKHVISIISLMLLLTSIVSAQDPYKDLKNAEKAVKKFTSNPAENASALSSAMDLLTTAFTNDELKSKSKSWITKGKIFKAIAASDFKSKTLDLSGSYKLVAPNAAVESYNAYTHAAQISDKKNEKKEIQVAMVELENHLNNYAVVNYQEQSYASAFDNFTASLGAYEMLQSMGKPSRLDDEAALNDQYFFTAVSGYYADKKQEAVPYLEKLYNDGSKEGFVYEALYNVYAESDQEKALAYLAKGIEMNPDDTGLLFAQINHYLKEGRLDELIGKLDAAIEKEPDNVSIYNTLGSVYDQLQQKELEAGNVEKSEEYFALAMKNYDTVLEKNPTDFDATYSVGAAYYNKAAGFVDQLNDLSADLSVGGMKKYDEIKAKMDGIFTQALPYFEKAESINNTDCNTIVALKEIYARLNDLEKSNTYKTKLEENCQSK